MYEEIIDNARIINSHIGYRTAGNKGLGVFALCNIKANTILTYAVIRTIGKSDCRTVRSTDIFHHLFVDRRTYSDNPKDCELHIAFGSISIINHAENPNCYLQWEYNDLHSFVNLIASRDIFIGEEIMISYENISDYDFL